jgi:hypothetical protein
MGKGWRIENIRGRIVAITARVVPIVAIVATMPAGFHDESRADAPPRLRSRSCLGRYNAHGGCTGQEDHNAEKHFTHRTYAPLARASLVEHEAASTKAGGQDRIDHPRHGHDDIANAVAGALVFAYSGSTYSAQQSFKDNLKLAAAYKKWAKAVA